MLLRGAARPKGCVPLSVADKDRSLLGAHPAPPRRHRSALPEPPPSLRAREFPAWGPVVSGWGAASTPETPSRCPGCEDLFLGGDDARGCNTESQPDIIFPLTLRLLDFRNLHLLRIPGLGDSLGRQEWVAPRSSSPVAAPHTGQAPTEVSAGFWGSSCQGWCFCFRFFGGGLVFFVCVKKKNKK